tara:strand:+ start:36 stop:389 length:354 start_codon:yes stop_codon:yes gene_type:complete
MYTVKKLSGSVEKNSSSKYVFDVPAHEIPMLITRWGQTEFVLGEVIPDDVFIIEDMDVEMERLVDHYGTSLLTRTFGPDFGNVILESVKKLSKEERKIDGGKNTAESKNGTSTTSRV